MTPEQLKASILQYAIQGKLVEQRPEEGTGEELYQQIQAEKQRLIKEGKIKKEKPLPEITEDEIPFDIPENWKWVRLGDLANINGGFVFKSTNYTSEGVRVIRISDFNEKGFVNDKIVRYPYDDSLSQYVLDLKNILLCMTGGTVGKSLFITELDEKMVVNQRVATIKVNSVMPEYIYQVILAPITQKVIQDSKNSTNDNISMDAIKGFLIPLPSINEQKRIVAKIEELLPYVDRYAAAYEKLEQFNAKFPEDMKKSILQYAIQGKLVEQRPEEGTGEELYRQIQEEKKRLIKEGKIKKEKPLPEIAEDEIPFDIPESWKWVRLNDAVLSIADIDHKMPETVNENGYPYISPVNFTPTGIDYDNAKMVGKSDFERLSKKCKPEKGDIVFPRYGTIGVVRMVDTEREFLVSYSCCTVKNIANLMHSQYVFYVLQSGMIKQEINRYINKTTQPNVGLQSIKQFLFPLPPLAEQKRIVAKLEEILPLCERLK